MIILIKCINLHIDFYDNDKNRNKFFMTVKKSYAHYIVEEYYLEFQFRIVYVRGKTLRCIIFPRWYLLRNWFICHSHSLLFTSCIYYTPNVDNQFLGTY